MCLFFTTKLMFLQFSSYNSLAVFYHAILASDTLMIPNVLYGLLQYAFV